LWYRWKIENYKVSLVVADGLGDEEKSGVTIYDIGKLEGRLNRIFKISKKVLVKAAGKMREKNTAYLPIKKLGELKRHLDSLKW